MARMDLTDEQVEREIARLQQSQYVKLAEKEQRVRTRRRRYFYHLRSLEKKGKDLSASGFTMDNLEDLLDMPMMTGEE